MADQRRAIAGIIDRPHGVRATYLSGCKCPKCRRANTTHAQESVANKKVLLSLGIRQSNRCAICEKVGGLVVDHVSGPNLVRGALCGKCNAGLGKLGDSASSVRAAIEYLRRAPIVGEYVRVGRGKVSPAPLRLCITPSRLMATCPCPECRYIIAERQRAQNYGITRDQFESMLKDRQGRCDICKRQSLIEVDHIHGTTLIRGMLCGRCNTGLGKFGDTLEGLLPALVYLEGVKVSAK